MAVITSFIFSILFWPGISSAATTPRWAFLSIAVPSILLSTRIVKITLSHIFLAALLIWSAMSFLWSPVGYEWTLWFFRLLIISGLFLIGTNLKSIRPWLIGAAAGLLVNSAIVIAQIYGWPVIQQVVAPAGLFMNKNLLAEFAGLVLVGVLYERMWWAVIPTLPSVVLTDSRGVFVSLSVAAAIWVLQKRPRFLVSLMALAFAGLGTYYLCHFDGSATERIDIWRDTLRGYAWLGHGLGQYYVTFPDHAFLLDTLAQRPEHAHNDLIEMGYELGIGAIFVLAFVVSIWRTSLPTERAVLLAFGVIGCFSFPFYMPTTAAVFALVAGRLAGAGASLRDDINVGRVAFRSGVAVITRFCDSGLSSGKSECSVSSGISDQERASISLHSVEASRNAA